MPEKDDSDRKTKNSPYGTHVKVSQASEQYECMPPSMH